MIPLDLLNSASTRKLFAKISVVYCTIMTSGYMWNHINEPPFIYQGPYSRITIIAKSPYSQTILESYIVILLSLMTTVGLLILTGFDASKSTNNGMTILGLSLIWICFSILYAVFSLKV